MSRHRVQVSWSGNGEAELEKTVPITSRAGDEPRVVMSLGPRRNSDLALPGLEPGDRLEIAGELEVTTDASDVGRVGSPYDFAPKVEMRLLLASGPGIATPGDGEAVPLGPSKRIKLDHDLHHGVFVFDGRRDDALLELPEEGIGWGGDVYVNAVLTASHRRAGPGHVVLIGQNEPDGSVLGDMGALCSIRGRPVPDSLPEPIRIEERRLRAERLPLQGDVKRVVYSAPLDDLETDEQLRVRADVHATAQRLGYRARIKTRVFLADSPTQAEPAPGTTANRIASSKGQITKANGFNCLPANPRSETGKVGVLRILEPPSQRLYVNVACVCGDPDKRGRSDDLDLLPSGRLVVTRFPAGLRG